MYPTSGGVVPAGGGARQGGYGPAADIGGAAVQELTPWSAAQDAPRRRSPLFALVVILVVAVLGGITAAVVAFVAARPDRAAAPDDRAAPASAAASSRSGPSPSAAGGNPKAPAALRLRDDKTAITLTWTDPSKGTVPFIVAGGQQGALRQLQVLSAGATTYTLNGLNPKVDYCFTVAAIYGTDRVELSDLACTQRR